MSMDPPSKPTPPLPPDPRLLELLHRADPGWFFHSHSGILYFLHSISSARPQSLTPPSLSFELDCPRPMKRSSYDKIYRSWAMTSPHALHILSKICRRTEKGWEADERVKRAVFEGRVALSRGMSVDVVRRIVRMALGRPVGEAGPRSRMIWDVSWREMEISGEDWDLLARDDQSPPLEFVSLKQVLLRDLDEMSLDRDGETVLSSGHRETHSHPKIFGLDVNHSYSGRTTAIRHNTNWSEASANDTSDANQGNVFVSNRTTVADLRRGCQRTLQALQRMQTPSAPFINPPTRSQASYFGRFVHASANQPRTQPELANAMYNTTDGSKSTVNTPYTTCIQTAMRPYNQPVKGLNISTSTHARNNSSTGMPTPMATPNTPGRTFGMPSTPLKRSAESNEAEELMRRRKHARRDSHQGYDQGSGHKSVSGGGMNMPIIID